MLSLRFRSKDISAYEKKVGKSIYEIVEDNSIDRIVELISMGYGCDIDKAYDILDTELEKEGVDTTTVFLDILESLQRWGFFPKSIQMSTLKMKMMQEMQKANLQLEKMEMVESE